VTRNLDATELKRLHRERRRATTARLGLILEDVQNPFNVGSIVRTAAAMGVEPLWLVGATPPLSHPKVQKTALGTQRFVTTVAVDDGAAAVAAAHAEGLAVIGMELAANAAPVFEVAELGDVALVVGHEDRGLSKAALTACDRLAYIPQVGKVASLNVATAAAIALYEVRRRHWSGDPTRREPGPPGPRG
jgi:tRNA (guanosine-2'-O-)-methyltransferase